MEDAITGKILPGQRWVSLYGPFSASELRTIADRIDKANG